MKYTFEVFGRPKHEKVDEFMDDLNKNLRDLTQNEDIQLLYNAPLETFSFEVPDNEENKKKIEEFKVTVKKIFSDKFSDVQVKQK